MSLNFETMCRICLKSGATKYIFPNLPLNGAVKSCSEMFSDCLYLAEEDGILPPKLCKKCFSKLVSFGKFKILALNSYKYLLDYIKNNIEEKLITNDIEIKGPLTPESNCDLTVHNVSILGINDIKTQSAEITKYSCDSPLGEYFDFGENNGENSGSSDDPTLYVIKKNLKYSRTKVKDECVAQPEKANSLILEDKQRLKICDLCGKQVVNIKQHIIKHSEKRKRLPCENCDRTFMTYGARKNHNLVHHMGLLYYCELCKKHYKRGGEHRRIVHSNRAKQHKCIICEKTFLTRSNLDLHMTTHSKVKPFQCSECGKTFRLKYCMIHHKRRVHEGEKSHICQYCSKGFFSPHHLRVHLRSHTKEKVYKCEQCSKMFSTMSAKRGHEKRHTGLKAYQCQYCDMSFYDNGALRVHTVSHTKEKNYECKYCNMKFGRSDHRNRHQRTAHEKNILFTFVTKDLQ